MLGFSDLLLGLGRGRILTAHGIESALILLGVLLRRRRRPGALAGPRGRTLHRHALRVVER